MFQYLQMRNWFIILMILSMTYMIHQKMNSHQKGRFNMASTASFSIFR